MYDVAHADFTYHVVSAFREQDANGIAVASDTDGDGLVSAEETNDYAHTNTTSSVTQIGDYRNIAPLIFISNAQPDAAVPQQGVYSRDYAEDNGTEPSDYMNYVWFHGPDLWVRNANDGITTHQDPEFGQPNYLYARIHNIGCNLLNNVTIDFSWCTISAWASPASWNAINTVAVNNFQSSESDIVSTTWNSVPAPGSYCLHTVLNAPGDPSNADGRAYIDNNKVQINVDIVNNTWGWRKNLHWVLENGLERSASVDLVIEKSHVPFPTQMEIVLPEGLRFKQAVGGKIKQTDKGMVFSLDQQRKQAAVLGIMLEPLAKKNAVLSVVTPKRMQVGDEIVVKVSEQLRGREVGGIVFRTRTETKKVVLSNFVRRLGVVFRELGQRFEVKGAQEIFSFCEQVKRECRLTDPSMFREIMSNLLKLEKVTTENLVHLMNKTELRMFEQALKNAEIAFKKEDEGLFVEFQEELIMSTVPLFLRKMKKTK